MKKIVYVPVYIDGKEENLPKESGVYFAEKNDFEKGLMYFDPNGKGKLQEYDVLYWMEFARFWLKPTEVTDEDITKWANDKEKIEDFTPETLKLHIRKKIDCRIEGAKAMRNGEINHKEG